MNKLLPPVFHFGIFPVKKMPILPLLILGMSAIAPSSLAQNVQFPANSTFFTGQPPNLVNAATPTSTINWPDAPYYFTFSLPENSVESLGKITIQQQENAETIQFNLSHTKAFRGTQDSQGQSLTFKVTQDPKTQAIAIVFDPPVSPGTTFSIRLEAVQNPSQSGIYLFNLMAFPAGENPTGLDLGVGRFQFYQFF